MKIKIMAVCDKDDLVVYQKVTLKEYKICLERWHRRWNTNLFVYPVAKGEEYQRGRYGYIKKIGGKVKDENL